MYRDKMAKPGPNSTISPEKRVMPLDSVEAVVAALESEISSDDALLKELDDMYDQQTKMVREISYSELQDDRLRNKILQSRQLLDSITKKLAEITLAKDFGGYECGRSRRPVSPEKYHPMRWSCFLFPRLPDCSSGCRWLTSRKCRTRVSVHPPKFDAGWDCRSSDIFHSSWPMKRRQKQIAAGEPCIDPMLCTHYASNSVSAEAYRSIRTAIYFNTQGIGHQVIQITSPNMADGKSTLATNLAVSIAQSGKKTILIDGDCRRPRIHKIFNVAHDTGLASVIAGQSDLATAIRPTAVPNLAVLPCGPRPANPAELLTSPRFKELLDIIRAQYDFVLIDTPPLLVVTDPCVVAPRGRRAAGYSRDEERPPVRRACQGDSEFSRAHVLGVVVNGLGGNAGGRYGYGYRTITATDTAIPTATVTPTPTNTLRTKAHRTTRRRTTRKCRRRLRRRAAWSRTCRPTTSRRRRTPPCTRPNPSFISTMNRCRRPSEPRGLLIMSRNSNWGANLRFPVRVSVFLWAGLKSSRIYHDHSATCRYTLPSARR